MAWFYCPTEVFLETYALRNNAASLLALGKRCLVVTGRTSAAASGALDDLASVLPSLGIAYEIFDEVEPNPSIHTCRKGGLRAKAYGASFVLGVGGGSALDAAKAVAAYAAGDMAPMDVFGTLPARPLPVAAIPTTAGTGSEVNPYAVLTIPELGVKRTFSSPQIYPVVAFLDPRYTASLPYDLTVGTALDAFCHCAESYFSPKATSLTRALCVKGADLVWRGLQAVTAESAKGTGTGTATGTVAVAGTGAGSAAVAGTSATAADAATADAAGTGAGTSAAATADAAALSVRADLLAGAMLGGMGIAHTGTGYPHPTGYNLTLYHGISHGAACAVFEGGYLRRQAAAAPGLYADFMRLAALPDDLPEKIGALAGPMPRLSQEEISRYAGLVAGAKNYANSIAPMGDDAASIAALYQETFDVNPA